MTCCNRFSRWLEAILLSSINSATVTNAFTSKWICRFSIQADLVTDRGLQFTSNAFTSAVEALDMRTHTTTTYHLQSNGLVERTHRRLKEALTARGGDWMENLP